jgi:hypothetical protein
MAVNDTLQLAVIGAGVNAQDHVHTLHFRANDPLLAEQQLIDDWQAGCRLAYRNLFSQFANPCTRYVARQVCGTVPLRAAVEETEVAPNIAGTRAVAGDDMPPYVAYIVSVRTASAGRSRRGRFYIGGLMEGDQAQGNATGAYTALVQAYINALNATFLAPGGSSTFDLVVHSRKLAAPPGTQCQQSSTLVTGMIPRSALGTMRSRKAGSGN